MSDPLEFEARAAGTPPLLEGHEPEARHVVHEHLRKLPPKASTSNPNEPMLEGLDWPEPAEQPIREVPVRRHLRRNPRQQKEPQMLEHEDRVLAHALAETREEAVQAHRLAEHRCPDDGACWHSCPGTEECWRVVNAGPLSGVFYGDTWPVNLQRDVAIARTHRQVEESRAQLPGGEAHARSTDPTTSHLAAAGIVTKPSQIAVLRVFRSAGEPMADFELEMIAIAVEGAGRFSPSRLRSARSELQAAGLVRSTGDRRPTPYGRVADVHELTDAGRTIALPPLASDLRTD